MTDEKPAPAPAAPAKKATGESRPTPTPKPAARQEGLQIDGFGLPVNGPARARILTEIGADDPAADPEAWTDAQRAKARDLKEQLYG